MIGLMVVSLAVGLFAQQQTVTVGEGSSATLDVPFSVQRFDVSDRSMLEVRRLGERSVQLQGVRAGTATVTLIGEGGATHVVDVRIQTDVRELESALRAALEDVPEVETARAGDRVVLRGRVSSLANWSKVERVTAAFGHQVLNLTELEMPPEILVHLRDGLMQAGFRIAAQDEKVGESNPGVLSLSGSGRTVHVSGAVFSPKQLEEIHNTIASQRHLRVVGAEQAAATETSYTAAVNVSVVPLIIEVDLAFIAVNDAEHRRIGVNLYEAGLLSIDAVGALAGDVTGTRHGSAGGLTYDVASNLSGTLRFFTQDTPDREIYRGQLHFRNGTEEWRELHSGGTLQLRLVGREVAEIQEIDYGFILKALGGLKDAETAALDLEFELSTPSRIDGTDDYDIRRERVLTAVDCRLGHTMAIGGVNSLLESADASATPILRSIPLLNTFFSQRTNARTDKQMLVLISPHIRTEIGRAAPLSDGNVQLMELGDRPVQERMKERRPRRFFFF